MSSKFCVSVTRKNDHESWLVLVLVLLSSRVSEGTVTETRLWNRYPHRRVVVPSPPGSILVADPPPPHFCPR